MQAKEEKRAAARALYEQGHIYSEIVSTLNVAKSSVSNWCKDLAEKRSADKRLKKQNEREEIKNGSPPPERKGWNAEHPYLGFVGYLYKAEDGVKRVNLCRISTSEKLSISFNRYRMSVREGRILTKGERVIRKHGDSDDINNLIIVTFAEIKNRRDARMTRICELPECDKTFVAPKKETRFCSPACKYAHMRKVRKGPKKLYVCECVICEIEFQSGQRDAEICSSRCRKTLQRMDRLED